MAEESELTPAQEIERLRQRVTELEQATEQRKHEARGVEERYQAVLDWSDTGVWEWNVVSREAYMSPGWFRILGYEPGDLPNNMHTWSERIFPEDVPSTSAAFIAHLEGRTPAYEIQHRMNHKSGKTLWIRTRGKIYERDAEGRPIRVIGTVTDITEQKEADDALRRSQSMLQALIDNSPALIHVRDLSWRFLLLNKPAEAALGVDREEAIGRPDYEFLSPQEIAEVRPTDEIVVQTGAPASTERMHVSKAAGPRNLVTLKFPIRDERGKIIAIGGMTTDTTERKRVEEEHLAMRERVIAAQRDALRELSTPLLPIGRDVVVMPLIGTIDSQRAQQLIEALLRGVVDHRAATVIIDVTGVPVVDTHVAGALVQASKGVRLLGATAVLTGIRPEVARTLVSMGAELGDIVVHGTLRGGIAYALQRAHDDSD
jgi:rsbT co-antagonist protein RsbR